MSWSSRSSWYCDHRSTYARRPPDAPKPRRSNAYVSIPADARREATCAWRPACSAIPCMTRRCARATPAAGHRRVRSWRPSRVRAVPTWLTAALVPVQHAHRAQGVPMAGPAIALVHAELEIAQAGVDHFALVWVLERQSTFGVTLRADQVDGLGHARIGRHARCAQVVEPAQRVVVPAGREREQRERSIDQLAARHAAQHPAVEQIFLPPQKRRGHLGRAARRSLVLQKALEDVDRRVERSAGGTILLLAVPPAIGHLLAEQPRDDAGHVLAEVRAHRHDASVDAWLDLAGEHRCAVPGAPGVPRGVVADEGYRRPRLLARGVK